MDLEKHIEDLVTSKSFDSLTPAKKEMVLSMMTENEYVNQHAFMMKSKKMFQEEGDMLSPDTDLLFSLRAAHTAKKNSKGAAALWASIAGFRIPAYQVGIAAALLFMLFWRWPTTDLRQDRMERQVVYETIIDTIQVIKEIPVEVMVPVERVVREIVYLDRPTMNVDLTLGFETNNGITPSADAPDMATMEQSFGNSSFSNEDLDQFRVGI